MGDDEGGLNARDLVPAAGGEWHGLLFDNQAVGLPPALTWTFRVPFEPVGGFPAALDVEWVPLEAPGWRSMAGLSAESGSFAEPAEASVHHHGHHRYDRVSLSVSEQDGSRIRVLVTVSGDLDGLGPASITVDAWLSFAGIRVQLGDAASAEAALARLASFTDVEGLAEHPGAPGVAFLFVP
ncbi:hypothetical protein [Actinoplanes subtropicus]|uniref:hypothetical protein n=1 Tax=Actinoplanes subtropicus TaxID=543632 RepID=UPI0004C3F614|nr:hypothetical protein [Actinoplanes subtropicus]